MKRLAEIWNGFWKGKHKCAYTHPEEAMRYNKIILEEERRIDHEMETHGIWKSIDNGTFPIKPVIYKSGKTWICKVDQIRSRRDPHGLPPVRMPERSDITDVLGTGSSPCGAYVSWKASVYMKLRSTVRLGSVNE